MSDQTTAKSIDQAKFDAWMRKLDAKVEARIGCSVHDLADQPFRDWFDSEMTVAEAFEEICENEGLDFEEDD